MVYTTKQGDTWDMIAKAVYDDEMNAQILWEANPRHLEIFIFPGGVQLACTELSVSEITGLPDWRK